MNRLLLLITVWVCLFSCEDLLEENTYTVLQPSDFFNTLEDAEITLHSVYGELRHSNITRNAVTLQEVCTDIALERSGGIFTFNEPIEEFVWTSTHQWLQDEWERGYRGIFKANVVLDNLDAVSGDEVRKAEIRGEAIFLRAFNYYLLYNNFGPVPLVTTSLTAVTDRPARASEQEMIDFMVSEFRAAADALPLSPPRGQYGRPTRGAALGALAKLHLMVKDWDAAAATAREVMDLGVYDLFTEGNRTQLFAPENQRDNEFIFVSVMSDTPNNDTGDGWLSHVVPRGYQWQYPPRQIFAAEYKIRSEFLESFEPADERLDAFLFEFVNADGDTIQLGEDDVRSLKFPEYPTQEASRSSDDFPYLRYADILLSRAEALNEVDGVNAESVALLNEVRAAAGVDSVATGDFASADDFRQFLLEERGREFHTEALRRQDMIRHGVFIDQALARGKPAEPYHVRYPIPLTELERNESLVQNEGY
jgi:hypothetical protein